MSQANGKYWIGHPPCFRICGGRDSVAAVAGMLHRSTDRRETILSGMCARCGVSGSGFALVIAVAAALDRSASALKGIEPADIKAVAEASRAASLALSSGS